MSEIEGTMQRERKTFFTLSASVRLLWQAMTTLKQLQQKFLTLTRSPLLSSLLHNVHFAAIQLAEGCYLKTCFQKDINISC